MKKFIKRLNEFLPQAMQMNSPTTKPTIKPNTKPGRPGPIPTTRPSTTPKPQATAMDVYNHFIDTLREFKGDFEFDLGYLTQKYEGNTTTKPTTAPPLTKPGRPGPIPTTRPSTTPKPQALGQFESLNLKSFSQFVNEARHEENPAFSDDYKRRFSERIGTEAGETQRRVQGRNVPKDIMSVVNEILRIQRGHERELEKLAYDVVMENYGSILDYVDLEIRFPRNRNETQEMMRGVPKKVEMKEIKDRRTIAEINRRKVGKMVMQAEAKRSKALLNFAREGMIEILGEEKAARYLALLNQIGDLAHIQDLVTPESAALGFWSSSSPVGVVDVSWQPEEIAEKSAEEILAALEAGEEPNEEDLEEVFSGSSRPKILAVGNDFSLLLHEAIKGIWQLIISASIPEDVELSKQVIENTDTLADEIEDLKYGPIIAKDINAFVNMRYSDKVDSIDNFKERLFGKMITESNPMTFLKMIRAILMEDYSAKGMTRIDQLAQEVEDELREYDAQMRDYEAQTREYNLMQSIRQPEPEPMGPADLSQLSIDELNDMLEAALDEEDYILASQIKKAISSKRANESRSYYNRNLNRFR